MCYDNDMKKRIDVILFEKGYYPSREKAKQAIEMKRVKIDGKIVPKPSFECEEDVVFETLPFEFVSRGGFKLQKAIEEFQINLSNKVVLDIGASTGGFSDVCLQENAKLIYAVDTGEGQLAEKIKQNAKVLNWEKTNFLDIPKEKLKDVNFVVIDVSFVSLTKFAPKLFELFENKSGAEIVALIKPQFECGLEYARKHKGIVKDSKVYERIIKKVVQTFESFDFEKIGLTESPIKGGDGNTEFLIYLRKK